jgi:6,7-dimethyl-8-ribityllumazine synthase
MPHNILIVSARFYNDIAAELEKGAIEALKKVNATYKVIDVPGALEVPAVIRYALATNQYDGFIALGCVIRGETSHYDTVCHESSRALNLLTLQFNAAIGNGILTVENNAQAMTRARIAEGDKGGFAANACLRLVEIKQAMGLGLRP